MMWKDLFGKKKKKITHPNHKMRGKWYTQKEVEQYKDGKLIAIYNSACEVQRKTGYAKGHIVDCCNGKRRTAYGYEWKYMDYNYLSYEERCKKAIEDIKFCLRSIKQEAEMSKDERTRKEMRTCLAILNETLNTLQSGCNNEWK